MAALMLTRRFHRNAVLCSSYNLRTDLSTSSHGIDGPDSRLPVLIVGAGPVGLVLSILLTKLGSTSPIFLFLFYFEDFFFMLCFKLLDLFDFHTSWGSIAFCHLYICQISIFICSFLVLFFSWLTSWFIGFALMSNLRLFINYNGVCWQGLNVQFWRKVVVSQDTLKLISSTIDPWRFFCIPFFVGLILRYWGLLYWSRWFVPGVSQIKWTGWWDFEASTACRLMEEVCILHFAHRPSSWFSWPYAT